MKILDLWKQQDLSPESQERLQELIDLQRYQPDAQARRDSLIEAFLDTLTEAQVMVFARMLRELTQQVH